MSTDDFDLYIINKLPSKAKEMDLFYCKPLPTLPKNPDAPWFVAIPVGKNTLATMVKKKQG